MNAYTTKGQIRIQQRDIDAIMRNHAYFAGASLAALERERGWQAEAERARLLKQHGLGPAARASLLAVVRQTVGAALVHAGERLMGLSRPAVAPEPGPG